MSGTRKRTRVGEWADLVDAEVPDRALCERILTDEDDPESAS